MDNPVLNRAYQVVSAVGQAARLQFLNAEKLAEDLQAQRPRYDAASAGAVFVPELSSGTGPVYPAAPHTTFEMSVLVSTPSPQPAAFQQNSQNVHTEASEDNSQNLPAIMPH